MGSVPESALAQLFSHCHKLHSMARSLRDGPDRSAAVHKRRATPKP
jgi:hypothetical protein